MPALAFLNLPNLITLAGMALALVCMQASLAGRHDLALAALLMAGVCDLLDGLAARRQTRTPAQRQFGQSLDSLVDVVSFGVAPLVFLHSLDATPSWAFEGAAVFYLSAVVMRLSYFSLHGVVEDRGGRYYSGMPVTYAAFLLPVVMALMGVLHAGQDLGVMRVVWPVGVGVLFLSRIRFKKPSGTPFAACVVGLVALCGVFLQRGWV